MGKSQIKSHVQMVYVPFNGHFQDKPGLTICPVDSHSQVTCFWDCPEDVSCFGQEDNQETGWW